MTDKEKQINKKYFFGETPTEKQLYELVHKLELKIEEYEIKLGDVCDYCMTCPDTMEGLTTTIDTLIERYERYVAPKRDALNSLIERKFGGAR